MLYRLLGKEVPPHFTKPEQPNNLKWDEILRKKPSIYKILGMLLIYPIMGVTAGFLLSVFENLAVIHS